MDYNYNSYHTFKYGESYYLYDIEELHSCIIDSDIYNALIKESVSDISADKLMILENFHRHNIFFKDSLRFQYLAVKYDTVTISLALSHNCNLQCKYCFADAGSKYNGIFRNFTIDSIATMINFLLTDNYFSQFKNYRINLVSGGEPLLDKKLFHTFITTIFSSFEKTGKHLYVWFSTNGTLLDVKDLEFIKPYNVGYGISLDGIKTVQNSLRIYKDGTGTYEDIVNNIGKIQEADSLPNRLKELWGLMVYTGKSENLSENIAHLSELGFSTVQMRYVRTIDSELRPEKEKVLADTISFVESAFSEAQNGNADLLRLICNDNDYIGKIIKRFILKTPYEVRCMAGSYNFSFAADGNIYPCDSFVGDPDFVMGSFYNMMDIKQLNKFEDLSIYKREKCKNCWVRFLCGGDCYHNSFIHNNNIFIPDVLHCEVMVPLVECVIACSNQYRLHNGKSYKEFQHFLQIREEMSKK